MLSARVVLAGAIAALVVAIRLFSLSPASAHGSLTGDSPSSTTTDWNITGQILQMNGQFWDIQGFVVKVTANTSVTGAIPSVGEFASATGTVLSDGTWLASTIRVGDTLASIPTSTPTSTGTSAPTSTSTPTPSPSSTQTVTPVPSGTPTIVSPTPRSTRPDDDDEDRVVTPTSKAHNDDQANGDDDRRQDDEDKKPLPAPPHPQKHAGNAQGSDSHGKKSHDD